MLSAAQRAAVVSIVLFVPRQKGRKNAPRDLMPFGFLQCAVAGEINLAARRKSRHLQILRARLKESRTHLSITQAPKQKDLLYLTHLSSSKFSTKTILFLRLPLVVALWRSMYKKVICFSPLSAVKSGTKREVPEGTSGFLSWLLLGKRQEVASKPAHRARVAVRGRLRRREKFS